MAYAAVVSLVRILDELLRSDQYAVHDSKPEIESLYDKVCSLQSSLEKIFPIPRSRRDEANDLEIKIRDAIYRAQDIIEAFISFSSENQISTSVFLQDLQKIIADVDPVAETAEEIAGSVQKEPPIGDLLSGNALTSKSSRNTFESSRSAKIVGQEEDLKKLRDELLKQTSERRVIQITGLPGIGKTTLAQSIYEDKRIMDEFGIRSWVTVGQEYHVGEIFLKLLGTMESKAQKSDVSDSLNKLGDKVSAEKLAVQLYQHLFYTRYLIVIDDIWDIIVWDKINKYLPDNKNSSWIVLTTRNETVARKVNSAFSLEMQRLDQQTSWRLLCETVFGGGHCPPQFEAMGKEIAKHCHGLPLSITVVGGQLSQKREEVGYWKIVEDDTKAAAASEKDTYLEILSRSYDHLPGRLKGCFLYMGAFPEDSEIFVSKLIKLWIAEGFLTPYDTYSGLEKVAEQYLYELVDRNLIFVRKTSSDGRIRTCGMHDSIRYLAETKSQEENFFHYIKKSASQKNQSQNREQRKEGTDAKKGKDTQRRISVHKNKLMCMKDVYKSTKSMKFARTLLYAGPNHHHPLPSCLTFDFLRVLDALTVYFIEFPDELVKLIHLRYLSLTYNGKLPPSLSRLQNLLVLIVRRHPKIIIMGNSILPDEIWNMPNLRHVLLTESDFPDLPEIHAAENSVLLNNLQSLSNVHAACCTKEVLQNMPNLKKLGIWIEAPDAVGFCLDQLEYLEAFKFTVLNPVPDPLPDTVSSEKIVILPELVFPATLKRLSLSGCGFSWEDMTIIGQLPCLEVLKLREFAFQGPVWCPRENEFDRLKFLLLESLNLKDWLANHFHFPSLERLIIRQCYELEKMDTDIGDIGTLKLIELVGCSPSAVTWAEETREEQEEAGNKELQVRIYSSWE